MIIFIVVFVLDNMSLDLDLDQFNDHLNGTNIGVDDVDSQDVDITSNMRNNGQNQAEKRAHHNALERKRRDHIKGSFSDLRDVIPSLKGEKVKRRERSFEIKNLISSGFQASRAHVLKSATEYIRTMKTKNQQFQKNIEELKRQNAAVELQSIKIIFY